MSPWRYVGEGLPELWVAGHIPWPFRLDLEGNIAPPPPQREDNLAPRARFYDPENVFWAQNLADATLRLGARDGFMPRWFDAQDVPVRLPGARRLVTLREIFAAFRAQGVAPHALGPEWDGRVAAGILHPKWAAEHARATAPTPEEGVSPDPRFTLAAGLFPRSYPTLPYDRFEHPTAATFQFANLGKLGTMAEMLQDVAAMGFGRVRRVGQRDLYWACLFPADEWDGSFFQYGAPVLPPAEIRAEVASAGYVRLAATSEFLIACLVYGMKADLTLFTGGGGMSLNQPAEQQTDEPFPDPAGDWTSFFSGKPAWQAGALIPSSGESYGWDPWYWNHSGEDGTSAESYYQKWATNVWPVANVIVRSEVVSDYRLECARRKSLGLAAYSEAIADYIENVASAVSGLDTTSLLDLVDTFELGNEMNAFWVIPEWETLADTAASDDGEREAGRLLALLAGPIRARFPSTKAPKFRVEGTHWHYRVSETTGVEGDDYAAICRWVSRVFTIGLPSEVLWWQALQWARYAEATYGATMATIPAAWWDTAFRAGALWPPDPTVSGFLTLGAADLVQQSGNHWFHDADTTNRGVLQPLQMGYADSVRQGQDVDLFEEKVIRPAAAAGIVLHQTMGATDFPAEAPPTPGLGESYTSAYYAASNRLLQAGMLVRYFALCVAKGLDLVGVFTFHFGEMASSTPFPNYTLSMWKDYDCAGVHNEVYSAEDGRPSQGGTCWRRPSWFALRRLVWLKAQSGLWSLVANEVGLTVVEVQLPSGVATGPDGTPFAQSWRRAYLMWYDQLADSTSFHSGRVGGATARVAFLDRRALGYELVPVAPDVDPGTPGVNALGYAERGQTWGWSSGSATWSSAAPDASASSSGGVRRFEIELVKASPSSAPLPILMFTDAEYLGHA